MKGFPEYSPRERGIEKKGIKNAFCFYKPGGNNEFPSTGNSPVTNRISKLRNKGKA